MDLTPPNSCIYQYGFKRKISLRSWRCCSLRSKRFCAVRDFFGSHPIFRAGKIPKIPFFGLSSMLPNPMETLATQASSVGTILFAASPLLFTAQNHKLPRLEKDWYASYPGGSVILRKLGA